MSTRDMISYMDSRNNSILDLAVDGTELLIGKLLGLGDQIVDLGSEGLGLVATLGNNVRVVRRATAVPGQDLSRQN